jgi:16S rRNA pseudouridine516 synthase
MTKLVRLDKLLANLGLTSRSKAKAFIAKNNVMVKGMRPNNVGQLVNPQDVSLGGKPLEYPGLLHIAMNKPRGYVCSRDREGKDHKLIYDLLPETFLKRRPLLVPAGRLDKWAAGLLILSQDGDLIHRIISPKKRTGVFGKVYHIKLQNAPSGKEADIFASGELLLKNETVPCKPAKFEILNGEENLVRVTLFEGRYHQLRRMLAAVGHTALEITRVQVGPIELGDLNVGEWRLLTDSEVDAIRKGKQTQTNESLDIEKILSGGNM